MPAKNNTQVLIDGKVFTLSGYEEEEYLNKVASYINNKIMEMKQEDGFRRQNKETQSILIQLNIADDYYKVKKQADLLELELEDKNKELYELKHDLISLQIKVETAEKEIERFRKEAAEYEAQDKKRKEAVEVRNDADSMVFQTEKALADVGDKISAEDKSAVEADLAHLKELVEKSNPEVMSEGEVEDIKAAKEKLMTSAQSLFTKMYEQMQGAGAGPDMGAGAGPDMGSASNNAADDVVDADYREV